MKLLIGTDAHLFKSNDGKYWCDSVESYEFWTRYLDVFDSIRLVARVKQLDNVTPKYKRADGEGVEVWDIPFYQGPVQLFKQYVMIKRALNGCYENCGCALYRIPSQTAQLLLSKKPLDIPYAGEVVYCPRDDIVGRPWNINKLISMIISKQLRNFCKNANGVSYVTEKTIQKYYPCKALLDKSNSQYFTSYYSSVALDQGFYMKPRKKADSSYMISISDAAMNSDRKGEKTVIETIGILKRKGYDVKGVIIGDGSKIEEFKEFAKQIGVAEFITFTGMISDPIELRNIISSTDFYMLPTSGEGLPRGILEAMALGLPVLSTNVGGIAEVVHEEFLFDPKDSKSYAIKIGELIDDNEKRIQIAEDNYNKAIRFRNDLLQERRNNFYRKLKAITEEKYKNKMCFVRGKYD